MGQAGGKGARSPPPIHDALPPAGPSAEELYDHAGDDSSSFDKWENTNLALKTPQAVKSLRAQLVGFFQGH